MSADIVSIFEEVANQMRSDLEKARKAIEHSGLKGAAFEETLRGFLRQYLPKTLDVSTGILVDSHGNSSRQLDIIISDSAKTPIFYRSGDVRVTPVECAYAVIEVKANLDSEELEKVFVNMESVRKLKKTAYVTQKGHIVYSSNLYGKEWEIWPTNYYVFAYDSINLNTLAENINYKHITKEHPPHSRIDTVCVLDKGVIFNRRADGTFCALPDSGSKLCTCETKHSLLLFYTLISTYLNQVRLPHFKFNDYLGKMEFGKAHIVAGNDS